MSNVIIFMGLQGAGKTTLFRARFASTHVLVSKDLLRNNRRPSRRQSVLLRTALATGRSVVVDNTNPSRADREDIISLAREYDARIVGYFFESPLEDCLRRNAARVGRERVPEAALFSTPVIVFAAGVCGRAHGTATGPLDGSRTALPS